LFDSFLNGSDLKNSKDKANKNNLLPWIIMLMVCGCKFMIFLLKFISPDVGDK
jgi:hypothetical protein